MCEVITGIKFLLFNVSGYTWMAEPESEPPMEPMEPEPEPEVKPKEKTKRPYKRKYETKKLAEIQNK